MKKKEFVPLQQRLIYALLIPCLLSLLFGVGILVLSFSVLGNINYIFGQQDAYSEYFENLTNVENTLTDYLENMDVINLQLCQQACDDFYNSAKKLADLNGTGKVINFYYMAATYLEAVEGVLERNDYTMQEAEDRLSTTQIWSNNIRLNQNALWMSIEEERIRLKSRFYYYVELQTFLVVCIFVALTIMCFMISKRVILRLMKPIRQLTQYVESTKDIRNIPEPDFSVEPGDETYILASSFFEMMKLIQNQFETQIKNDELRRELQEANYERLKVEAHAQKLYLQVLQSRVNPHFLFNSLSIAISIALEEDAEKTCDALETLASYLRYSLSNLDKSVTISEEIQNVEEYCLLQHERFGERIDFRVFMESECGSYLIPAMIIQPLVENSVIHGIDTFKSGGYVEVRVSACDDIILLEVEDNGKGLEKEDILKLYNRIHNKDYDDTNGVGLYNVYQRITIFFQEEVPLEIKSIPCKKTIFILKLPKRRGKDSKIIGEL